MAGMADLEQNMRATVSMTPMSFRAWQEAWERTVRRARGLCDDGRSHDWMGAGGGGWFTTLRCTKCGRHNR